MGTKGKSRNNQVEILIVEDSPTQAQQLRYFLEQHDFQISLAGNGKEALALLAKRKQEIVISDIIMPEMDGYELCRQIKADERLKDIPVILVTRLSEPRDVIRGLECGADNFITKPYDEKFLLSRIQYLILNRELRKREDVQMAIQVSFAGEKYNITSDRLQILNLLLSTYEVALQKNMELTTAHNELRRLNERLEELVKERTAALNERVKELKCLHGISTLTQMPESSLEEVVQNAVNLLPPGWLYPEVACARILLEGQEFKTENFRETVWRQSSPILSDGEQRGMVEVYYLEEKPECDEGPFLKEERRLIDDVARQLSGFIERKKAEKELRSSEETARALLNATTDSVFLIDSSGTVLALNEMAGKRLNKRVDEMVGACLYDFLPPDLAKKRKARFDEVFHTGKPTYFEDERQGIQFDNCVYPISDVNGKVMKIAVYGRDITEQKRAQEALRESEKKYRTILDNIEEGYYEVDLAGNFTFLNDSMCRIFGYPKEELIGMNDRQYTDKENAKRLFQAFNEVYRTGEPHIGYDYEIIRKDGSKRYVETSILLQRDSSDKAIGFRGIIRDISERKRAEQALLDSEQRYRNLVENAPDVIFTLAFDGTITSLNPAFETITGWSRVEWLHKQFVSVLHPDDLSQGLELFQHVLKGEKTAPFELRVLGKSGDYLTAEFTVAPQIQNGSIIYILGIGRDITDRKRAEEGLKQSEENARQLAEENAIMAEVGRIISSTLNIDEVYEGFSLEAKKIIPFDRIVINAIDTEKKTVRNVYISGEGLPDRNAKDIYPLEGSGNAEMVRTKSTFLVQTEDFSEYKDRFPMLLSTFQSGFKSIMNVPLFSKGKIVGGLLLRSQKPYAYTEKEVKIAERIASQIAGAVANAQLYAERLKAEQEREALQEQLRQSQKMEAIGRLAGGVAHDFNNLLTVIKGYSQLSAAEMKKDDPLRENIEEIMKATDRAADLTRQLLAFSRRQVMEMRVLDLNELLANLDKMLRRMIGEDIDLVTMPEKNLGRVKTDPGQMEQVIMNLAVNARDAMPDGGKLTIETANVELDQAYAHAHIAVTPGRYVMISVSDTGVGMTPEVRDRVFEPFFTTKAKGKGTGLGLSTVYGIVKQSGGNIWVYSELGKGTTFKIYLLRVDEPPEELRESVVSKGLPRGRETILIVEDEEVVLKLAGTILRRHGYEVWEALSGEEALKMRKRQRKSFHLLLTDVVMPQMSGRQLADQLKEICQGFRVLYMSGYTDNAITHHGVLDKGMNYLQKPFTVESLVRKVREVLG